MYSIPLGKRLDSLQWSSKHFLLVQELGVAVQQLQLERQLVQL